MILLIDNYDSFVFNLYQFLGALNPDIRVIRNDELTVDEIRELAPTHIVLSPGPGHPRDAGVCGQVITELGDEIPILGVCLGHQAICEAYGGTVGHARQLMHGKQSDIKITGDDPLFADLPSTLTVARYHSLAADPDRMPEELEVTAISDDGEVMAVRHRTLPVHGVQFHPESIMSPDGMKMLENFLTL